jgi:hypothetical protein
MDRFHSGDNALNWADAARSERIGVLAIVERPKKVG